MTRDSMCTQISKNYLYSLSKCYIDPLSLIIKSKKCSKDILTHYYIIPFMINKIMTKFRNKYN